SCGEIIVEAELRMALPSQAADNTCNDHGNEGIVTHHSLHGSSRLRKCPRTPVLEPTALIMPMTNSSGIFEVHFSSCEGCVPVSAKTFTALCRTLITGRAAIPRGHVVPSAPVAARPSQPYPLGWLDARAVARLRALESARGISRSARLRSLCGL